MQKGNSFRNPVLIQKAAGRIKEIIEALGRPVRLMEVCGTHTHSIFHFGIRDLLPDNLELLSGPGCPVCVTPMEYIDQAILLANQPGVILTTFGDLMRVPGRQGSLLLAKAEGARVEVLYSPLDSLEIASAHPDHLVVFLGVGFETTAPLSAVAIEQARAKGLTNFKILNAHKLVPPALELLAASDLKLDGFILPGHVSAIIGLPPYRFLAEEKGLPAVVTGFEPMEILHGILNILEQLAAHEARVENVYGRVVKNDGNPVAIKLLNKYFTPGDSEWRGLGVIPGAGLLLKEEWREFDLLSAVELTPVQAVLAGMEELRASGTQKAQTGPCICGLILTGKKTPLDCPSFANGCTPESPFGACMVSSEGTCAAYYRYQRRGGKALVR